MGWFTRIDRFGDWHMVFSQEAENSCGIACVTMVVFKVNKLALGSTAVYSEKEIDKVYSDVSGTTYDGSAYSYANYLADTLNKLKCGTWNSMYTNDVSKAIINSVGKDYVGLGSAINSLRRGYPIIVLVGWGSGGAHFVVVDTVNSVGGSLYAAVCDPWDGNVHMTAFSEGKPFQYKGAPVPWAFDIGGARHDYSSPSAGAANGWIVHRL